MNEKTPQTALIRAADVRTGITILVECITGGWCPISANYHTDEDPVTHRFVVVHVEPAPKGVSIIMRSESGQHMERAYDITKGLLVDASTAGDIPADRIWHN